MIKVYENKSDQWFDSMKFAAEYYGIPVHKVRDNIDVPFKVKGVEVFFTHTPAPKPNKFRMFVRKKGLKHMIGNFYLNKEMEVWMWAKKKEKWYEWKTIKFDNGNVAFKTKTRYNGMWVNKWVQVNQYYKGIFGEAKEVASPF